MATAIRAAVVTTVKSDASALPKPGAPSTTCRALSGQRSPQSVNGPPMGNRPAKTRIRAPEDDRRDRQAREQPAIEAGAQVVGGKAEIDVGKVDDVDSPERHPERVGESARRAVQRAEREDPGDTEAEGPEPAVGSPPPRVDARNRPGEHETASQDPCADRLKQRIVGGDVPGTPDRCEGARNGHPGQRGDSRLPRVRECRSWCGDVDHERRPQHSRRAWRRLTQRICAFVAGVWSGGVHTAGSTREE